LSGAAGADLRLDRWLWHARLVRRRERAGELVAARRVRVNGQIATKTHQRLRPGDVVTVTQPEAIQVIRVLGLGERRGRAVDAVGLYETLAVEAA
jgi:ribosome-associated heat shock protein Hsp15